MGSRSSSAGPQSAEASSPQLLDVRGDPRQAVDAVHHAVLLDELRAALEDLGHCRGKHKRVRSISGGTCASELEGAALTVTTETRLPALTFSRNKEMQKRV